MSKNQICGALMLSPPTFSNLVTIQPTHLVLVTFGLLNFSTHVFLVRVTFSPRTFCSPPWPELWQVVHTSYIVNLGTIDTSHLEVDMPSDSWNSCFFYSYCNFKKTYIENMHNFKKPILTICLHTVRKCLAHFSPSSEKLVPYIMDCDYSGNRLLETLC